MSEPCDGPRVYRPRRPRTSPLWRLLDSHFEKFLEVYEQRYRPRLDILRDIAIERIRAFLKCGILEHG